MVQVVRIMKFELCKFLFADEGAEVVSDWETKKEAVFVDSPMMGIGSWFDIDFLPELLTYHLQHPNESGEHHLVAFPRLGFNRSANEPGAVFVFIVAQEDWLDSMFRSEHGDEMDFATFVERYQS